MNVHIKQCVQAFSRVIPFPSPSSITKSIGAANATELICKFIVYCMYVCMYDSPCALLPIGFMSFLTYSNSGLPLTIFDSPYKHTITHSVQWRCSKSCDLPSEMEMSGWDCLPPSWLHSPILSPLMWSHVLRGTWRERKLKLLKHVRILW